MLLVPGALMKTARLRRDLLPQTCLTRHLLQPVSFDPEAHTYFGSSARWQGDLPAATSKGGVPRATEVYFRNLNLISSTSLSFLPTIFTINGKECSITRGRQP